MIRLITKEASTVPQPTIFINPFDKCFLPKPLIKKPINGSKGIKKIKFFIPQTPKGVL
jgi:hypothetical protein